MQVFTIKGVSSRSEAAMARQPVVRIHLAKENTDMQWTPDLAVGVEKIDNQHQEMFKMAGQLFDAENAAKGPGFFEELLAFLDEYTKKHFADEEAYMESIGYPGLEEQQRQHADFLCKLVMLREDFEQSGRSVDVILKTNRLVLGWLQGHILCLDKKIGEYARAL